jgi:3-phenylpropionate/cinnamic acid dioxygenase small subunit
MSIDELLARESIRDTMARYTIAGDRLKTDEFIATFTDDALFESDGVPERDAFRYQGKQAIREWIQRWLQPASSDAEAMRATFVRHHLSTSQIELLGADSARARTYWVAHTDIGPDHSGYYLDTFNRVRGEWLIAHRKVRLDWRAPNSLFMSAIEQTRN